MNHRFYLCGCLFWAALYAGCGAAFAPIETAVVQKDWQTALRRTNGNAQLEFQLAVRIIQQAALESDAPKSMVLALPESTDAGHEALLALRGQHRNEVAAQMAEIVLNRNTRLAQNPGRYYLDSDNSDLRALAATTLSSMLSRSKLHLMTQDLNSTVRAAAVAALCRLPAQFDTADILVERLKNDPLPHVRAAAARCGFVLEQRHTILLRETIANDANMGVQRAALQGLLQIATQTDMNWLVRFAKGPMTEARLQAAAELAHRHLPEGKARLLDALDATNDAIRVEAITLLRYGNIENADERILHLIDDPSSAVSTAAAMYLFGRGVYLEKARTKLEENGKAGNENAQLLLAQSGDIRALRQLRWRLRSADVAADTVARYRFIPQLRDVFVSLLAHSRQDVRLAAAVAVSQWQRE
ncbi:MAG: hypothetical protein JXR76_02785 [Deltaproteobacteria bacterium]|nr:hypothetical protein [Deltaproteobacteria bacterium]